MSPTTLRTTVKKTQYLTVINTMTTEISTAGGSTISSDTKLAESTTITVTRKPSTLTRTLSTVADPVQSSTHFPVWASSGWNVTSATIPITTSTATATGSSGSSTFADESTIGVFQTSYTMISLSEMLAHSGFMNNPGPNVDSLAIGSAGLPIRTPISSRGASATALTRYLPNSTMLPASNAPTSNLSGSLKSSSATSSTPVHSTLLNTPAISTTFSALSQPTRIGSKIQYPSTRRYLNTTTPTSVATSTIALSSSDPTGCSEQGDFSLNVSSSSHSINLKLIFYSLMTSLL